jgi:hypothetical protein
MRGSGEKVNSYNDYRKIFDVEITETAGRWRADGATGTTENYVLYHSDCTRAWWDRSQPPHRLLRRPYRHLTRSSGMATDQLDRWIIMIYIRQLALQRSVESLEGINTPLDRFPSKC